MQLIQTILTGLLVFIAIGSGAGKLAKVPNVMKSMESVGVKPQFIPVLAALEFAGGLGIIAGIWITALGTVAAICLALYFLAATFSHLKSGHKFAEFAPALIIFGIAVAVSVLSVNA